MTATRVSLLPNTFRTDRSGNTFHIERRDAVNLVGYCGVSNKGTQWTQHKSEQAVINEGGKVCPRCFTARRWGR